MSSSDDLARNVEVWTRANADYTDSSAPERWAQDEITWGMWGVPEGDIGVLGDVSGLDVLELGCGTACFSAWLKRRGARTTLVILCAPNEWPCGRTPAPAPVRHAPLPVGARRGRVSLVSWRLDPASSRERLRAARPLELQAPQDAANHPVYDFVAVDWGRRWPAEEIWVARKRA